MSVLTHVVLSGSLQPEPAATQSLAYILNEKSDIAQAFVGMFNAAKIEFKPREIRAEITHENARPDLTIYDDQGQKRAIVENKYWTGFTDAQPVDYLEKLPDDVSTALLFIVPERRVITLWSRLKQLCCEKELEWENGSDIGSITWSRVGCCKFLLITNWTYVLKTLLNAADLGGHDSIRRDILQLQDLTNQIDNLERFLPIRTEELTDQETARRLINYCDLIKPITQKLEHRKIADNVTDSCGWYYNGKFLRVHKSFRMWFGFHFQAWRKFGVSPLWWMVNNNDNAGVRGHLQTIRNRFEDAYYEKDSENLCIPILLKIGVERETVVEDATKQITEIADKFRENIPNLPL